ncbi:MAG TPA: YdcF family protein [Methylibium sp.]
MFGLEPWKPILSALALPPVPLLLLILLGARLIPLRRWLGFSMVFVSVTLLWLSACQGTGRWLQSVALRPPQVLSSSELARLQAEGKSGKPDIAIVVLGGGLVSRAPEYGVSDLTRLSLQRLRYGVYLSRATGLPLAYSGGVGWADGDAATSSEAEVAARITQQEYRLPLRWVESASRDTRENAGRTVPLLRAAGIKEIVLVTHAWHMPRALRVFEEAAHGELRITPAPMGYFTQPSWRALDWLPTREGMEQVALALHELLGLAVHA